LLDGEIMNENEELNQILNKKIKKGDVRPISKEEK